MSPITLTTTPGMSTALSESHSSLRKKIKEIETSMDVAERSKILNIFDQYPVREIRQACLKGLEWTERTYVSPLTDDWAQPRIEALFHAGDGLWEDLLRTYTFYHFAPDKIMDFKRHWNREADIAPTNFLLSLTGKTHPHVDPEFINRKLLKILGPKVAINNRLYWLTGVRSFLLGYLSHLDTLYSPSDWSPIERVLGLIFEVMDVRALPHLQVLRDLLARKEQKFSDPMRLQTNHPFALATHRQQVDITIQKLETHIAQGWCSNRIDLMGYLGKGRELLLDTSVPGKISIQLPNAHFIGQKTLDSVTVTCSSDGYGEIHKSGIHSNGTDPLPTTFFHLRDLCTGPVELELTPGAPLDRYTLQVQRISISGTDTWSQRQVYIGQ